MAKTEKPVYVVVSSMVGKHLQDAQVTAEELEKADYEVERLLEIGAIAIYDPEAAFAREAALKVVLDAEKTPREIELEETLARQQTDMAQLAARLAALEAPPLPAVAASTAK